MNQLGYICSILSLFIIEPKKNKNKSGSPPVTEADGYTTEYYTPEPQDNCKSIEECIRIGFHGWAAPEVLPVSGRILFQKQNQHCPLYEYPRLDSNKLNISWYDIPNFLHLDSFEESYGQITKKLEIRKIPLWANNLFRGWGPSKQNTSGKPLRIADL